MTKYLHFYSISIIYLLSVFFSKFIFQSWKHFYLLYLFASSIMDERYLQFDPIFTWHRFFECKQVKDQLFPLLLPIHAIFGREPRLNSNDAPNASATEFCNISNISPSTIRILSSIFDLTMNTFDLPCLCHYFLQKIMTCLRNTQYIS